MRCWRRRKEASRHQAADTALRSGHRITFGLSAAWAGRLPSRDNGTTRRVKARHGASDTGVCFLQIAHGLTSGVHRADELATLYQRAGITTRRGTGDKQTMLLPFAAENLSSCIQTGVLGTLFFHSAAAALRNTSRAPKAMRSRLQVAPDRVAGGDVNWLGR